MDAVEPEGSVHETPKRVAWVLLGGFFLVEAMAQAVYSAHGVEPSARFRLVTTAGSFLFLWFWFSRQLAPHPLRLPMDMGVLVVLVWFVSFPYFLWRFEGWRGLRKLAALVGLWIACWAAGVGLYLVLR
jgi:hypothetical protein